MAVRRLDRTYEELKLFLQTTDGIVHHGLDRTYEELKHSVPLDDPWCFSEFGSYLWGIETRSIEMVERADSCLDRTYEELKLFLGADEVHFWSSVWIVPMRNWNLLGIMETWEGQFRLDRTYEELKPASRPSTMPMMRPRLDRTYEELKQPFFGSGAVFFNKFGSYLWGIETHPRPSRLPADPQVWIVPMRNWNRARWPSTVRPSRFGSYLWGIETS